MYRKTAISSAVLMALTVPMGAQAFEVSGYLKNETSVFARSGQVTGAAASAIDNSDSHSAGDLLKFENSARLFVNGDIGENAIWHADLNFIYDSEAVKSDAFDYRGYEPYSQHDYLRELYVEMPVGGWDVKLGKQQVVWGTADGMKLLDVINPTDYRELNQNTMEDSRIPVWMAKVERELADNKGNLQFVLSQSQVNVIPGLNEDGDAGHPFIMKGVDAITGEVNGFLNLTPALGATAQSFTNAARFGAFTGGAANPAGLLPFAGLTVDGFASGFWDPFSKPGEILPATPQTGAPGFILLNNIAQCGLDQTCTSDPNANNFVTNLMPVTGTGFMDTSWDPVKRTSAFEHLPNATFATFNTFAGAGFAGGSAGASYRKDLPDSEDPNFGVRFKQVTSGGLGYSLNYLYNYDPNPYVDLDWHDSATGEKLTVQRAGSMNVGGGAFVPNLASDRSRDQIRRDLTGAGAADTTSILLRNASGQYYGAVDPTFGMMPGAHSTNPVELRFTEKMQRSHNLGASFDYALDTESLGPVVLRGEFLYQMDAKQPVVDNLLLGIGDLANGLSMEDADMFKYVLGADITVLTNMMISAQFIQFVNLDYVNDRDRCATQTGIVFDCSRYTADFATMNPTNGLRAGEEFKEFYSLFFSKPFGPSQRGRWNNITIYEDGGGWWNRFDVDWSFTDSLVGLAELNYYWGDENTTFGQFKDSSNVQVGLKYFFY
jgi:hypothetical protein